MTRLLLPVLLALSSPALAEDADESVHLTVQVGADHDDERPLAARLDALEDRVRQLEGLVVGGVEAADDQAVVSAGAVEVAAGVTVDDAVSFAGPVEVRGTVAGDAVAMGGDVRVFSGGRVRGNAVSFGGTVIVEPGGEVLGDRVGLGADGAMASRPAVTAAMAPAHIGNGVVDLLRGVAHRLAVLLSIAGAGVLLVGIWPRQVDQVSQVVARRPFWYGVAGAILTAAALIGATMLSLTVVGLPIALLLAVVLAVAWLLGIVAICKAAGDRMPFARGQGAWAAFLWGAALIALVGMLPLVGQLVLVLAGFPAIGAALVTRLGNRSDLAW